MAIFDRSTRTLFTRHYVVTCESVHVITCCMLPYIHLCVYIVIEITAIYKTDNFAIMIKFDFTSHSIIVLCLMVILVSTLIIINSSVNSKWGMGPFM